MSSESKRVVALRHFSHRPHRIFRWSGARRGLRHDGGRMRKVEGGEMEGESCWKNGGGRTRLYTWPRGGLADEAKSDANTGRGGR
jgi:hypothetical protein